MAETIFNLIAVLYRDFLKIKKDFDYTGKITEEAEDVYNKYASNLVSDKIDPSFILIGDKKCIDLENYCDIISACKTEGNYFFYRAVLCYIDSLIDIDDLVNCCNFLNYSLGNNNFFNSLNDNSDTVGVTIIPRVKSFNNTISINNEDKRFQDANAWYDEVNNRFKSIICIENNALMGYRINNVVLNFAENSYIKKDDKKVAIGFASITNKEMNDIVQIDRYYDSDNEQDRFRIKSYHDSEKLTDLFLNNLFKSKDNTDIFIGPEMMGSLTLSEPNDGQYNTLLKNDIENGPYLIVTPSYWTEGKNYLSVYLKNGRLIGRQFKQYRCNWKKDGRDYVEGLNDIPREVLLLHINGWGRISFPICIDLLMPKYIAFLVEELRVSYLLCPSYSEGDVQFSNVAGSVAPFGTKLLWLNTCSALKARYDNIRFIGYVSAPVNEPGKEVQPTSKPIEPLCDGNCCDNCYFKITIQGKSTDTIKCNEITINHCYKEEFL